VDQLDRPDRLDRRSTLPRARLDRLDRARLDRLEPANGMGHRGVDSAPRPTRPGPPGNTLPSPFAAWLQPKSSIEARSLPRPCCSRELGARFRNSPDEREGQANGFARNSSRRADLRGQGTKDLAYHFFPDSKTLTDFPWTIDKTRSSTFRAL
jgi:hypothetical protein